MHHQTSALSDVDFLYSHVSEYLDDLLEKQQIDRFHAAVRDNHLDGVAERFNLARGRLQLHIQKLSPSDHLRHRLYELVEDDATRANNEAIEIEDLSRGQWVSYAGRLLVFLIVVGVLSFGAYTYLWPHKAASFDALSALTYESDLIIENPGDRLDFLTQNTDELNRFFSQVPELGFTSPKLAASSQGSWELIGGGAIDYEVAKILVSAFKYKQTGEDLLVYTYSGHLSDLPHSDQGKLGDFSYQAYATDALNIIAWQANRDMVAMAVGVHAPESMADFAASLFVP